ncbi:MAG TPA: hypothetical protein DCZ91_22635 [Lachnospiraceae bacterium]|nr:hypothetical protein [Lachnospiraceae bacterium]
MQFGVEPLLWLFPMFTITYSEEVFKKKVKNGCRYKMVFFSIDIQHIRSNLSHKIQDVALKYQLPPQNIYTREKWWEYKMKKEVCTEGAGFRRLGGRRKGNGKHKRKSTYKGIQDVIYQGFFLQKSLFQ